MTLLAKLNRLPPVWCLVIARRGRRPVPLSEIARTVGLSTQKTARWLGRMAWDNVPVGWVVRLREACGITEGNERLQAAYLRRALAALKANPRARVFRHLDRMTPNQRARLRKMQQRATASAGSAGRGS